MPVMYTVIKKNEHKRRHETVTYKIYSKTNVGQWIKSEFLQRLRTHTRCRFVYVYISSIPDIEHFPRNIPNFKVHERICVFSTN